MKTLTVTPSANLAGKVDIPGDKSISHRALLLGSLADGICEVENYLFGGDCLATMDCMRGLGVQINEIDNRKLQVFGGGLRSLKAPDGTLNCVRSGTTMRLLTGLLAGQEFDSILEGDPQLLRRPMNRVAEPLRAMGADIRTVDGFAPIKIYGKALSGISHNLNVASAQVKSALILAGLYAKGETAIQSPGPSRDHTERMLTAMGADVREEGLLVRISPTPTLEPFSIRVPGDFSSAAFILAAGLLVDGSEILIKDVGINSTRTGLLDVLNQMGASISLEEEHFEGNEPVAHLLVKKGSLTGTTIGGETVVRMIDEFPLLAVLATQANGVTRVTDAAELRVKETDRITTVVEELRKMGAKIEPLQDGFIIEGPTLLRGTTVDSHGDHRLAMSLAVAGLVARGNLFIRHAECISDSFPGFIQIMQYLGAGYD